MKPPTHGTDEPTEARAGLGQEAQNGAPSLPRKGASDAAARRTMSWKWILKTAIGVGLLAALLVWNDNGRKLFEMLASVRPEFILALVAVTIATDGISSGKWGLFLKDRGFHLPWWRLYELYLIGRFYSNFLPSMFGGDLARVYLVGRQIKSYSTSAGSVVMERATGLVGLALLASVGCIINPGILDNPLIAVPLILSVTATAVGVAAFFMPAAFALSVRLVDRIPVVRRIAHKVEALLNEIAQYRGNSRLLLLSLAYSFAFHMVAVVNVYVASLAIGFQPAFLDIMVVTPVILLLSMIPVSPNNIGWWEFCFSVLLAGAGASAAEGLAVAVIIRAVTMATSLLGGLFALRSQPGT
ncbi:MAG: lysylphosphatidylglycerol synthase transmembrane domain-containing protein [Pseudomonadota bacterium]